MKNLFAFISCFVCVSVFAQEFKITGSITDSQNGNVIPGATISVLNSQLGTITGTNGTYTLYLPTGRYSLSVSHVSYASQKIDVIVEGNDSSIDFQMVTNVRALDEVIVTGAVKQEAPLLKVPSAITRLNESEIKSLRLWNVRDMSALSANVQAVNAGEAEGINFSIRGIGALNFNPSVVTYIDGVNQFDIYSSLDFLHNIGSIEMLKGPQGTLFGRNAMGGVINITSKQPDNILRAEAEATFGNFNLQRYNFFLSGPIIKNKLFFTLGGLFADREGYFTNTFDGSDFAGTRNGGGTLSLKYQVSDNWSLTLMGKRYERRIDGYLPFAANDSLAFANPFETQQDAVGKVENSQNQAALTTRYTGNKFNFTNVFAYQDRDYVLENVDVDFTPADFSTYSIGIPGFSNVGSVLTNEFTFSNPAGSKRFKWIAGSYAFWQNAPLNDITRSGEDMVLVDPTATGPSQVIGLRDGTNRGMAFFGQITYNVIEKVELSGGIRYDYEKRELTSQTDFVQGDNPPVTIAPGQTRETDFSAFSPRVSVSWFASVNTTLYASYTRGYRVGGINPTDNPDFIGYDPETSDNFEMGAKASLLDKKLRLGFSGFYINRTNIQSSVFEPDFNGLRFIVLSNGDGRNLGFEMEASYLVLEGLQLSYDFGYLDAQYTRLEAPDFAAEDNRTLEDKTVIQSPEFTSNLALNYVRPLKVGSQYLTINAYAQLTTIGEQFFDFENEISQSAYTLLNTRIGAYIKGIGLYLWAQNLTDERYLAFVPFTGATASFLGNPRTSGLSLTYNLN